MSRLFLGIYEFLHRYGWLRYLLLSGSFLLFLFYGLKVQFEEDVTQFFPDNKDSRNTEKVFRHLKIKDKILVLFSSRTGEEISDKLIEAGELFKNNLASCVEDKEFISDILSSVDQEMIDGVTGFIYEHLPVFLTEEDYVHLDSLLTQESITRKMQSNYNHLISPAGIGMRDIIIRDPLSLGGKALESLQDFRLSENYAIYDEHIFSKDMSTHLLIITPTYGTGTTGKNDFLIDRIEEELANIGSVYPDIETAYFGGPSVSVYNARQIKKDTLITMLIALTIIIVFISLAFKSRSAVFLIMTPVIYGAVFSLAMIWLIKGSVSAIAIGAGAAIFGVALSYSIHVISHFNHVKTIRQLIDELAYPMTVGSFTTVGAFFGLVFTSSNILRDFGLFSSFALIGTTFFSLVFLPHLLRINKRKEESGRVLRFIEKINGYAYEKNRPLVFSLLIIFIISLFFSHRVGFDSDMSKLSFEPRHIKAAEEKLYGLFNPDDLNVLLVSVGNTPDEGIASYNLTNSRLEILKEEGLINEYASGDRIFLSSVVQQERIQRWNNYWTDDKKELVRKEITKQAAGLRFREGTFENFFNLLNSDFKPLNIDSLSSYSAFQENWSSSVDSFYMFISQIRLAENRKEEVYDSLSGLDDLVIFDRAYFANKWVSAINNDFYLILYISSFLIFLALLISYGRIELTLMAFTPMAVSWVIILGIMAMTGTTFNIVNIILATFIFGLGDDFSIFIMDGLQQEYRTGKKLLTSHKTAIFFSSFTAVVGLGVLVFAKHPALQSIALISILGMLSVVLVSYTVLPILFRFFISWPASNGNRPYTLKSIAVTIWFYNAFIVGCSLAIGIATILIWFPISNKKKKLWFSIVITYMLRGFLKVAWIARQEIHNPNGEDFSKPSVIVANHQSFIDILILLSLSPRLIMVTNNWVWNSPFFGKIVRYADFVQTAEGYEIVLKRLKEKIADGYSVVVFPEGTRSPDGNIRRFHKGAFYIAEQLHLDILPIVLYGTGMVIPKRQPFYVRKGILSTTILPRIPWQEPSEDNGYREKSKEIRDYIRTEYNREVEKYSSPDNPWFFEQLMANYIYKGPVQEWYIRVKVRMEKGYDYFNRLIPRNASVTDIGCGYGMLSYMLALYSPERKITGIDYDQDKIELANRNFSRNQRISFRHVNVLETDLPESDVFIINDTLHYLDFTSQKELIKRCIGKLQPGGKLIIRDSDCEKKNRHFLTRFTEFLSIRLTGFNKSENSLCFPSRNDFIRIASQYGLHLEEKANDNYTSNTVFVFTFVTSNKPG